MFSFDLAEKTAAAQQRLVLFLSLFLSMETVPCRRPGSSVGPSFLQRLSVYTRSPLTWRRPGVVPPVSAAS